MLFAEDSRVREFRRFFPSVRSVRSSKSQSRSGRGHDPRPQDCRSLPLPRKSERSRDQVVRRAGTRLYPLHSRPASRTRQDSRRAFRNCWRLAQSALRRWAGVITSIHGARATRTSRSFICAKGLNGGDRALVDVNTCPATARLRWTGGIPSEDGKYVAYGTSASGSEESARSTCRKRDRQSVARRHRANPRRQRGLETRQLRIFTIPAIRKKAKCPKEKRFTTSRFSTTSSEATRPKTR